MEQSGESENNRTTIAEIAEIAGVSIATVSRVLNNNPTVRQENIEKVERVLTEHGYSRSKERRTTYAAQTIGLIVPDISNPWFPSLIKGAERLTRLYEMNLMLSDSENDARVEAANIATMVSRGIDGLILVPTHRHSEAAVGLVDEGFPLVFLDRQVDDRAVNFVTSSNTEGAYQATK
ncbi:MAG: LacI family transcriptional regulator, partial [Spirochaetales bacterium]|nr:LacI family transcriptional regulator [Spirochaetales bacterium]